MDSLEKPKIRIQMGKFSIYIWRCHNTPFFYWKVKRIRDDGTEEIVAWDEARKPGYEHAVREAVRVIAEATGRRDPSRRRRQK